MEAAPPDLAWLVERPIAHRGLHDRAAGRAENTVAAARAAAAAGFAIEFDVQLSADGEAMVFHDFTLDRLTTLAGPLGARTAQALSSVAVAGTAEFIPTLPAFLAAIGGVVPLVCEIKSAFDGDMRLADRVTEVVATASGRVALKSFDPAVVTHLRATAKRTGWGGPIGVVAEAGYADPEWAMLSPGQKQDLAALAHFPDTRPDFLSYAVDDLPHAAAILFRAGLRRPVMSWTVRTPAQRERARSCADQMVFEGFLP